MKTIYSVRITAGEPLNKNRTYSGLHEKETIETLLVVSDILLGDNSWKKPERQAQKTIKKLLKNYHQQKSAE